MCLCVCVCEGICVLCVLCVYCVYCVCVAIHTADDGCAQEEYPKYVVCSEVECVVCSKAGVGEVVVVLFN